MSKPVQECLQIVIGAKKEINDLLRGTEHTNNLLEINQLFKRLETRFTFMGGVTEPENFKRADNQFPPITNFMGEEIKVSKRIEKADLNPKQAEKQKFLDDVHKLFAEIEGLPNEQILNSYTLKEHQLIIRGVAKLADVEEYDTREINAEFLDDIKTSVAIKKEEEAAVDKVNNSKQKENKPTVLTQDDIDKDPDLQKLKAVAGDVLITGPKGQKSIKKEKP